jgi:hypothetical protein
MALLLWSCQSPEPKPASPQLDSQRRQALVADLEIRRELLVKSRVPVHRRLWRVAYPLLRAGAGLCVEQTVPSLGFEYWNRYSLGKPMSEALTRSYVQDDRLRVFAVAAGGPAERSGLQVYDELLALDDGPIPVGESAPRQFSELLAVQLQEARASTLKMRRGDAVSVLTMVPEPVCAFDVRYSGSAQVGAVADGRAIVVTRGLIELARTDEELALVIARELGHNILNHAGARTTYAVLGSVVDIIAASQGIVTQGAFQAMASRMRAEEFEAEADYVGLYLMARAGLPVNHAPQFWQRLARNSSAGSHYPAADASSVAVRVIGMQQTIREIREKQDTDAPLIPELKTSDDYPARDESLSNR